MRRRCRCPKITRAADDALRGGQAGRGRTAAVVGAAVQDSGLDDSPVQQLRTATERPRLRRRHSGHDPRTRVWPAADTGGNRRPDPRLHVRERYGPADADLCESDAAWGQTVNVAAASEVRIRDLIGAICRAMGYTGEIEQRPPRPGDHRRHLASTERARRLVPFGDLTPLDVGIAETVAWYREPRAHPLRPRLRCCREDRTARDGRNRFPRPGVSPAACRPVSCRGAGPGSERRSVDRWRRMDRR